MRVGELQGIIRDSGHEYAWEFFFWGFFFLRTRDLFLDIRDRMFPPRDLCNRHVMEF